MSKKGENDRAIDGFQSVIGIVGITLGVIPLVRLIFTGEFGGLFLRVFGSFVETPGVLAPVLVIAASVAAVLLLESVKKHRNLS